MWLDKICRVASFRPASDLRIRRWQTGAALLGTFSVLLAFGATVTSCSTSSTSRDEGSLVSTSHGSPSGTTSTQASAQVLAPTPSDSAALTAEFAAKSSIQPNHIAIEASSVHVAYVPSSETYWALASFTPLQTATSQELVNLQDGHNVGIFKRSRSNSWQIVETGFVPFCPVETVIPISVRSAWHLTNPAACTAR